MKGFFNRLLVIDMDRLAFDIEPLPDDLLRQTLGGKGLATYLLLKHNPPGVDPLSPENRLIFVTGPVADTPIWGGCRYGVYTKSPQTGFYSEAYSGGTTAEYMARSGFDGVMITGRAKAPTWIEISDGGVEFHSAADLWGSDTYTTEDRVKDWVKSNRSGNPKSGVLAIGPAGENRVAFAVIENEYWRSAGRSGGGAVMGSKNIKAIAFRGARKRDFADPEKVKSFAKALARDAKENPGVLAYKSKGTPMMVDVMSGVGSFPTRYWHKGRASHQAAINAAALHERMSVVPNACRKCFIACGRLGTVKEGRHAGLKIEGPEYETIYAFGGLCEIETIEEVAYLNDICDRLGMDTISAGNLAALTIEASRQGRIDVEIDYGQVDRVASLLHDIAHRKGIGEVLSHGIKFASKQWGMADQAIHVKGLEPAGYDPRVLKGMGLAYGTSPRGACHLRTTFYKPELSKMIDPEQLEGKARMLAEWEDRLIIFDCLILCRFYRDLYQWEDLGKMIEAVTGLTLDVDAMRHIAGGISDNTRRFNLQEGLTPDDDRLPQRFHTERLPETDKIISEEQMDILLSDYYRVRGWDENGTPTAS